MTYESSPEWDYIYEENIDTWVDLCDSRIRGTVKSLLELDVDAPIVLYCLLRHVAGLSYGALEDVDASHAISKKYMKHIFEALQKQIGSENNAIH